jgi:2-polyprenyl-3-methyl-5-hydroxy-6-metoxy-1,4-benzoquinol methylase
MNLDIDFDIMREPGFFNRVLKERKSDWSEINKSGFKIITKCPICSTKSIDNDIFYTTEFGSYLKCKTCSCLYLENVPIKPNSGQYSTKTLKSIPLEPDENKREYRKERFGNERVSLIDKFASKPLSKLSLLDVGCNTGFFIEKAKETMNNVCGLEKERTLAEYASKKTSCKVYTDFSSVNRKFDVITLFDTLEHLENPVSFLQKCSDHLNDGGLLVIFTPNYKSAGFDILKEKCNHITPGHLVLFCKETCGYIGSKIEPSEIFYETAGMDIFDILSYERDINKLDIKKTLLYDMSNLVQDKLNSMGYANSLRVIFRKGEL